jgi:hypothetical protein
MAQDDAKCCDKCGITKPAACFAKDRSRGWERMDTCQTCVRLFAQYGPGYRTPEAAWEKVAQWSKEEYWRKLERWEPALRRSA